MRDFNFFSPYIETKKPASKKSLYLVAAIVLSAVIGVGLYSYNVFQMLILQKELAQIEVYLNSEETKKNLAEFQNIQLKNQILDEYVKIVEDANMRIDQADKVNTSLIELLSQNMPKGMFLRLLNISSSDIQLQGEADSRSAVAEYVHNLKETNQFASIHIANINKGTSENESYTFSMVCRLGGSNSNEAE